eukprot:764089-Hanusia_phi.AAC.8
MLSLVRAHAARAASTSMKRSMSSSAPSGSNKKLVLAYSGGLDTSTQLRWLADKGYEVIAFTANLGQGGGIVEEDFSGIEEKALKSGAVKAYVLDLQEDFVKNYVFPIIRSNAIYESRYLLGTSLARPCISKAQVAIAKKEGCKYVSHGSTGKGNDQVSRGRRLICLHGDMCMQRSVLSSAPTLSLLDSSVLCRGASPSSTTSAVTQAPAGGRIDFLQVPGSSGSSCLCQGARNPNCHGYWEQTSLQVLGSTTLTATPHLVDGSMDDNMFHISFESGVLEDPAATPPESTHKYTLPLAKCKETHDDVQVRERWAKSGCGVMGDPVKVKNLNTGEEANTPANILKVLARCVAGFADTSQFLNRIGGQHAIGRIDIVENRYVGIKSRGVYETPGGTILRAAHLDIEALTMDREVLRIRDMLSLKYSELVYNGFWYLRLLSFHSCSQRGGRFSPEMEFLQHSMDFTQRHVNGEVKSLYSSHTPSSVHLLRSASVFSVATPSCSDAPRPTLSTTRTLCPWTWKEDLTCRILRVSSALKLVASRPTATWPTPTAEICHPFEGNKRKTSRLPLSALSRAEWTCSKAFVFPRLVTLRISTTPESGSKTLMLRQLRKRARRFP